MTYRQCFAASVGPLKDYGKLCRCRNRVQPGSLICNRHRERQAHGAELVLPPWGDVMAMRLLEQQAMEMARQRGPPTTATNAYLASQDEDARWGYVNTRLDA